MSVVPYSVESASSWYEQFIDQFREQPILSITLFIVIITQFLYIQHLRQRPTSVTVVDIPASVVEIISSFVRHPVENRSIATQFTSNAVSLSVATRFSSFPHTSLDFRYSPTQVSTEISVATAPGVYYHHERNCPGLYHSRSTKHFIDDCWYCQQRKADYNAQPPPDERFHTEEHF